MLFILLLLFTTIPVAEIFILIRMGQIIGVWDTVGLVLITGTIGAYAAQTQGRSLLQKFETQLQRGEPPANSLAHGLLVFVGGILLITPGLITDIVGLSMIFPLTRPLFIIAMKKFFRHGIRLGKIRVQTHYGDSSSNRKWKDVNPETPDPNHPLKKADVIDIDSFKNQPRDLK